MPDRQRQEVLERVARGQHHGPDVLVGPCGHSLADRSPGVVADESDVAQVERGQRPRDEIGQAGQREVAASGHRELVPAERPVGADAPVPVGQVRDHVPPDVGVGEDSVHEDEYGSVRRAGLVDPDGAFGDPHGTGRS
nr:hypothetical protein [Kineosporia sp. R_H_3]